MESVLQKLMDTMADVLLEKKAETVVGLDIHEMTVITDGFLICSGRNQIQVKALADALEDKLAEDMGLMPRGKEGYPAGRWVILDYSDIVVHIFHKEDREFYNLERLWDNGANRKSYE